MSVTTKKNLFFYWNQDTITIYTWQSDGMLLTYDWSLSSEESSKKLLKKVVALQVNVAIAALASKAMKIFIIQLNNQPTNELKNVITVYPSFRKPHKLELK